jgi:ubiquinone/menaquinone biosynthesis C-methylase UbiE
MGSLCDFQLVWQGQYDFLNMGSHTRHPYDAAAPRFDRQRALPAGVVGAIRDAVRGAVGLPRPRILDLGAGTGRIGRPFVAAGDGYFGADLSFGMLQQFASFEGWSGRLTLIQADGQCLPFLDSIFDAVLLIQVVGAAQSWRRLVTEARRVLRPNGALIIGHTVFPPDGIDERMKAQLAAILKAAGASAYHMDTRGVVQPWLEAEARSNERVQAVQWIARRSPRAFLERQPTGARFSMLPQSIRDAALRELEAWAIRTFGSLDLIREEQHEFELKVFRFSH